MKIPDFLVNLLTILLVSLPFSQIAYPFSRALFPMKMFPWEEPRDKRFIPVIASKIFRWPMLHRSMGYAAEYEYTVGAKLHHASLTRKSPSEFPESVTLYYIEDKPGIVYEYRQIERQTEFNNTLFGQRLTSIRLRLILWLIQFLLLYLPIFVCTIVF